jgi:cell wall-associated NlpC family hydrolase
MKRYAGLAILSLLISIQSATQIATADQYKVIKPVVENNGVISIVKQVEELQRLEKIKQAQLRHKEALVKTQIAKKQILRDNYEKIVNRVKELKTHVGKTRYVFSGSSPRGWDCSGLTRWFYEDLGIELPHSAHEQLFVGRVVSDPQVGDLVLMDYWKNGKIDHAAIYIGNGAMIHSGFEKGDVTEIVRDFASVKEAKITYIRILDTDED